MITNSNEITKYENMNKIYIPNDKINSNYIYKFNGEFIDIITDNNCYSQYNSTYCDCYRYEYKNNVMSNVFTCSTNTSSSAVINYNYITSDINYSHAIREKYIQDKIIYFGIFIIALIFAIFLTKERKHL